MRIKQTWLGVLVLGSALSAGCGEDNKPGVVNPGNGGGNGAGSTDGEGGVPMDAGAETGGDAATFPDDKTGPVVVFTQPATAGGKAPIVGGTVTVVAKITDDPAGVKEDSVFGTIEKSEGGTLKIEPTATKDLYTFTFNASDFDDRTDLTLTVQAKDNQGNGTAEPLLMQLDTVPAYVSLEPPPVRFSSEVKAVLTCSGPIHSLGAAPKDGDVILNETRYRAFVYERALSFPGATEVYFSGVNDKRVQLLVQDDATKPLLTDGPDKDKFCDAVPAETDESVKLINLAPVKSAGTPPVGEGTEGEAPELTSECPGGVTLIKPNTPAIKPLCTGSELKYVPSHELSGGAPIVYGVGVTTTGLGCTGTSWDSKAKPGWNCVVVAAYDNAGNLGFSKPIRVCRRVAGQPDKDCKDGAPRSDENPDGIPLTPPKTLTCTDGCELPTEVLEWGDTGILQKN